MDWQQRLLEELVYERVRLHVDLLDLIDFERDLCESIARALRASGTDPSEEEAVARSFVQRAWRRLEQEWMRERSVEWTDCPLCEAPFECPTGDEVPARVAVSRGGE
ncbi:MAG TPA: hypothetical protein VNO33_01275 [Kofleriaceae bacterium]|nr:hypothetical protein [Kofleriaceae bacterium]